MSDLIDRRKAIDALKEYEDEESDNFTKTDPLSMMTVATIANCIEAIVELPSAEPERPKGKWEKHPGMNETCSECGHYFPVSEFDRRPFVINFCPYCGAEMSRGE